MPLFLACIVIAAIGLVAALLLKPVQLPVAIKAKVEDKVEAKVEDGA